MIWLLALTWLQVFRWTFFLGFFFLVGVGVWAIVVVTRMQREQAIALATLQALAARARLKEAINHIQAGRRTGDG